MAQLTKESEILQRDAILAEIVRRLAERFQPECIYLFGSQARGEAGEHSDYDLMMIVSHSTLPQYRRDQDAFRTLFGVGASKDILVLTRNEFNQKQKVVCSLPATIAREGILLYAA